MIGFRYINHGLNPGLPSEGRECYHLAASASPRKSEFRSLACSQAVPNGNQQPSTASTENTVSVLPVPINRFQAS